MITQPRHRGDRRQQGEAHPLQVLRRSGQQRRGRDLRPRTDADEPGQHPQERRQRLRHRAARAAPARAGRQLQEHDRPAAQEGPGALLARPTTGRSSPSAGEELGPTARRSTPSARCTRSRCTWSRIEHRAEVTRAAERRAAPTRLPRSSIEGDLCPFCRQMFNERMERYDGDWSRVLEDVRVRRLILSEQDRIGIGTFQPKDEKNQDATELTGDINYRKIAEYGTESDPAPSTSTASSTSPTAASSSSSRSSSSTWPSSTTCSAPARSTRSSPRSSPRPTSTR